MAENAFSTSAWYIPTIPFSTMFTTKNQELAIFGNGLSETWEKLIAFFDAYERGGVKGESGIIDTF
ncbi:MAG: hypothetical protein K2P23_08790, partial [Lachnospiraceae bacterium]|nr:hypothetical protein [Lachnospiraceae bacterium]